MRKFGTALDYHVPQRFQVHGPILGGQLVSAHSEWLHTEPIGPPWRLYVIVHRFFDRLIDSDSSEAVVGAKLDLKTPLA